MAKLIAQDLQPMLEAPGEVGAACGGSWRDLGLGGRGMESLQGTGDEKSQGMRVQGDRGCGPGPVVWVVELGIHEIG